MLGRNKSALLVFLEYEVRKRIQTWDDKFLTRAGKEVMLKLVVHSLPSYAMNVFLLPVEFCKDMERMIESFLVELFLFRQWCSLDELGSYGSSNTEVD